MNPTPSPEQEILLICGMHRSGTSLVAKCFEVFGYGLGETLMAPSDDNPKGFFEDLDVVAFNDALLEANGSSWDAPVFMGQQPLAWDQRQLEAGAKLLKAKLDREPRLAIKDPRLCLMLPYWHAAAQFLNIPLRVCLVYRNPLDIAASLEQRNGLPLSVGLGLTQAYWSQLLSDTESDSFVLGYEHFLDDPAATLDGIGAWLTKPVDGTVAGAFVDEFIDGGMQHHRHDLAELDNNSLVPKGLHLAAQALSQRSSSEAIPETMWLAAAQLDRTIFSELLAHQLSSHLLQLKNRTETVTSLELESAQKGFEIEDLNRQKAERETHIDVLEARVAETREELKVSQLFAAERVRELEKTQHDFEHMAQELSKTHNDFKRTTQALEHEQLQNQSLAENISNEVADKAALAKYLEVAREDLLSEQETGRQLKQNLGSLESDLAGLNEKADWLFYLLETDYGRLLQYEASLLGRLHGLGRRGYRLLSLQRGRATAYEDTIAAAHTFFADHQLTLPASPPTKWQQILTMVRYTLAHPISSLRSMSPARFRRVLSVIRSTDAQDLETWVDARFPDAAATAATRAIAELPPIPADEVLAFPESDQPKVSIVIPVYNEWVITHRCLWSILQYTEGEYEIIIADDCSTDETANIANYVTGVTVVRQEENQRFLKNCNRAAEKARGDFLLLLNNDTTVTESWLAPLLKLFENADIGIVGPKLLFPNGKLQEAGGIIWDDASGWNYGRADDPSRPQYNYVRETDYLSGAALMIRRSLWQELGGFDEAFIPAYYEDTDLCFSARAAGFKVVYQPSSTVVHYEGMTNGTDLGAGQKQYQVVNQQRFLDKWQDELARFHYPNAEQVPRARGRSRDKRSVLIIDHYVPHFDKDAGSRSTWMYIELMLDMGWRVQLIGANFFPHQPYTEKLQQMGVEVLVGEHMARNLDRWLADNLTDIDQIFLHRPHIAEQFLPHLKKVKACPPITFIGHDLHFLRTQREFEITGEEKLQKEADAWRRRELAVIEAVDHTFYFSDVEVDEINLLLPQADVRTLPLYVLEPVELIRTATKTPELLFVAGFNHPPNIDAAVWFVETVLPTLRDSIPDLKLHIAGSNPSQPVLDLASDDVIVHGYVSDDALTALYSRAACAVVPLRFGAGVKGKVLEAIRYGVPLVTTSTGAEGIPEASAVMQIANEPELFAQGVFSALQGSILQKTIREVWLEQHFGKERAMAALVD
ncbi:glycosyltransferase [Luminiphilus sp.]|nr:glycosyltransferase [Luminiphilus sp.]